MERGKRKSITIWIVALVTLLLFLAIGGNIILDSTDVERDNSVKINGVNVSGVDRTTAIETLAQRFNEQAENLEIVLHHDDRTWQIKGSDYEINSDIYTIIDEAQRREILASDFEESRDFVTNANDGDLVVNFDYLFVGLSDTLDEIISDVTVEPVNARVEFDTNVDSGYIIFDAQVGTTVDRDALYSSINSQYQSSNRIDIDLPMMDLPAQIDSSDIAGAMNKIASFSTSVSDSTGNRKYNVNLALSKFDGMVVLPHENVSFNSVTGPHTKENGYKVATIILQGKFTEGVGGGICQASTTLYNALLLAGRDVTDVQRHTLPVHYVPLGLDAMVAEGISDMCFYNNSDSPLIIHTYHDSDNVYVDLYSADLDGVSYKTRSEVVRTIPANDKVILDTNQNYSSHVLYKGERYRIAYAKDGYEVKSYLDRYEGDTLTKSTLLRHDTYQPQDGLVVEGALDMPEDFTTNDEQ